MATKYNRRFRRKSRLSKVQEKKNLKQALLFAGLSVLLILFLIFLGIPILIKVTEFFGERKGGAIQEKGDVIAPQAPTFNPVLEATRSATLKLTGYAEEEAVIKIVLNGRSVKKTRVDEEGEFVVRSLILEEGKNKIKAKAIDASENESDYSEVLTITLDTKNPGLEITSPDDGDKFFDKDKVIEISGTTEENATLYINNRLTSADSQGNFSFSLELDEGENKIEVKAQDLAGNETKTSITVSYTP